MVLETSAAADGLTWTGEPYTRETFDFWKAELEANSSVASAPTAQLVCWIEILMLASARPAVGKTVQVFHALLQSVHTIADQFELQKQIDAHLTERHSTETSRYRVGDLRKHSLLASMIQLTGDDTLTDEDQIPLTKPVGWLQHRETLNVAWHHRELLTLRVSASQNRSAISPALADRLQDIDKELEAVL